MHTIFTISMILCSCGNPNDALSTVEDSEKNIPAWKMWVGQQMQNFVERSNSRKFNNVVNEMVFPGGLSVPLSSDYLIDQADDPNMGIYYVVKILREEKMPLFRVYSIPLEKIGLIYEEKFDIGHVGTIIIKYLKDSLNKNDRINWSGHYYSEIASKLYLITLRGKYWGQIKKLRKNEEYIIYHCCPVTK